jgi:hypothetical protein
VQRKTPTPGVFFSAGRLTLDDRGEKPGIEENAGLRCGWSGHSHGRIAQR